MTWKDIQNVFSENLDSKTLLKICSHMHRKRDMKEILKCKECLGGRSVNEFYF